MILFPTVPCIPGTYYDNMTGECAKCERGTYQNGTAQTICEQCPAGMSTESDGAKTLDECFGK